MGHPDFQRITQWTEPPFLSRFSVSVPAVEAVLATVPVATYEGVVVWFRMVAGGAGRLRLDWLDTQGAAHIVASRLWHVANGADLRTFEPAMGGALTVAWVASVVSTGTLVVMRTNRPFQASESEAHQLLGATFSVSVGAGNQSDTAIAPYRGPAVVSLKTGAAAYSFALDVSDYTGTQVAQVFNLVNVGDSTQRELYLPSLINRVRFTNNDGVARSHSVTVVGL